MNSVFDRLPDETVLEMMRNLSYIDVLRLGLVSERFHVIGKDDLLWKLLLQRDFPEQCVNGENTQHLYISLLKNKMTAETLFNSCVRREIDPTFVNYFYDTRKRLSFTRTGLTFYPDFDCYMEPKDGFFVIHHIGRGDISTYEITYTLEEFLSKHPTYVSVNVCNYISKFGYDYANEGIGECRYILERLEAKGTINVTNAIIRNLFPA